MRGARTRRPSPWRAAAALAACALLVCPSPMPLDAGGPIAVGGPTLGISGQPFTWDPAAMPIQYRVDPGPLAKTPPPNGTVVIDHATGVARVKSLFDVWQSVPTAAISYNNAGDLLPAPPYTGGPVGTVPNFIAVVKSCIAGTQSPIIFDPDGSILAGLGLPLGVIGFQFPCKVDPVTGHFVTAGAALNGQFQDGIAGPGNPEITADQFSEAMTHEFGHLSGLDHSQINVNVLNQTPNRCDSNDLAGLPLMFPFLFCQARASVGMPVLAPDDMAWISRLYPVTGSLPGKTLTAVSYGTISGTVFFSDGATAAQGVNIIARSVSNPRGVASSVVSGYLFTGNFGQNVTCSVPDPNNPECNVGGSPLGSRDPRLIGAFDIPVPAGSYTVEVESIDPRFVGGSRVGPLHPPIPVPGTFAVSSPMVVTAGATTNFNMTLQGTPPPFDSFESARLYERVPFVLWLRRDNLAARLGLTT